MYAIRSYYDYGMTTREGVFAAGDVVHEPKTVILAMREGRRVAEAIDAWLQGRPEGKVRGNASSYNFV